MKRYGVGLSLLLLLGCADGGRVGDSEPPVPAADAPETVGGDPFRVRFETTTGDFVVEVHPEWAPKGAARFRQLVEAGFYDGCKFFRVVPNFVVQFGMNGDPSVNAAWSERPIADDPVQHSNRRGTLVFATSGPNSRTTQLFINLVDNNIEPRRPGDKPNLDTMGFAPFAEVVEGMEVVEAINDEYGEMPDQMRIRSRGNDYLDGEFPRLDAVETARIVESTSPPDEEPAADDASETEAASSQEGEPPAEP